MQSSFEWKLYFYLARISEDASGPLEDAKLSDAQIADVVNYVRTHFGNHYADRITAQEVAGMHP